MASSASALIKSRKEKGPGIAKATVADQICVAVQSTSNLLQLMQQSSPSQAHLMKLPKNLLAKASIAKNTGLVLEELPHVISSLDEYMESALQSAMHLKTVSQLLSNMENSQLKTAVPVGQSLKQVDSVDRREGSSDTSCEIQK